MNNLRKTNNYITQKRGKYNGRYHKRFKSAKQI